jgi:hypothetical protein
MVAMGPPFIPQPQDLNSTEVWTDIFKDIQSKSNSTVEHHGRWAQIDQADEPDDWYLVSEQFDHKARTGVEDA